MAMSELTEIAPDIWVNIYGRSGYWRYELFAGNRQIYAPVLWSTLGAHIYSGCKTSANALKQAKRKWREIRKAGRERLENIEEAS